MKPEMRSTSLISRIAAWPLCWRSPKMALRSKSAPVGREGYLGAPILHQVGITPYRVTAQIAMTALRIEAKAFLSEVNRESPLREMLLRYAHVVETQLVQAVVCNLTHTVEQRMARRYW